MMGLMGDCGPGKGRDAAESDFGEVVRAEVAAGQPLLPLPLP